MALRILLAGAAVALLAGWTAGPAAAQCANNPNMTNCTVAQCQERQSDVDFYCHDIDQQCSEDNSAEENQQTLYLLEQCRNKRILANQCYAVVDPGHAGAVTWTEDRIRECREILN